MKKRVDKKPWGAEDIFTINEMSSVKILNVEPGQKFSLQKHRHRGEFWRVLEGKCVVWLGHKKIKAKPGDEFVIKHGQAHRIEALSERAKVLEISFGKFDKKDIKRIDDDYGRA